MSTVGSPRRGGKQRNRQEPAGQPDDAAAAATLPYRLAAEWWRSVAEAASGDVVSRLVQAQTAMARFLETSMGAWTSTADGRSIEAARERFEEAVAGSERPGESGDLWRLYSDQLLQRSRQWIDLLAPRPGGTGPPTSSPQPLHEMTGFWWETFEKALGAPLAGHGLDPWRELEEKMRGVYEAWLGMIRANSEFQALLAQTWTRVFEEMTRELVSDQAPVTTSGALARLWIIVADRVFSEVLDSDTYIERQARVINAAADYRIKEKEIAEIALKGSHIASKSELDETSEALHALTKEVRALRREIEALSASSEPRSAAAADDGAGRGR